MDTSSHGEEAPPPHPTEAAVQAAESRGAQFPRTGRGARPVVVSQSPVR